MVGSTTRVLLDIYLAFQQWKNFENPLRIDKVVAMSSVCSFFWPTLYIPTVCWIYEGVHENIGVRWFVCDGSWNCHTAAIQRHAARYVNDGAIDHLVVSSRPTQRRSAAAVAALYGSSITRHAIRRILLYTKRCEMRNKIYRDLVEGPSGRIYDFMFSLNTHTQHSA